MSINSLGSMASRVSETHKQGLKISERLASGGTQASWSEKTSSQIDVSITTTNKIERLEGFKQGNALVENRLRTQVLALDNFIKLAQRIQTEFMPGSYTMGDTRPGLASIQEEIKNSFQTIGNAMNSISSEYAMGGVATQNPPMKNATTFAAYSGSPTDYSIPVAGSITVYINDEGDTVSLSGSDFDKEVGALYQAIMKLEESVTGADAAADQASTLAANAQKALLSKYYDKLEEINTVEGQEEELSNAIQEAMELRKNYTEDSVEELLASLMASNVMKEICQHLFTQEVRNAQNATRMLDQ